MKKKKKFPLFNSATNEKSPIHHPFVSSPGRGKQEKEEKAKKIRKKRRRRLALDIHSAWFQSSFFFGYRVYLPVTKEFSTALFPAFYELPPTAGRMLYDHVWLISFISLFIPLYTPSDHFRLVHIMGGIMKDGCFSPFRLDCIVFGFDFDF